MSAYMISKRNKDALTAAKQCRAKRGGNSAVVSRKKSHVMAITALQTRAKARATTLAPMIRGLQAAGKTTLRAIAEGLNDANVPTPLGQGDWSAVQVRRVLRRI